MHKMTLDSQAEKCYIPIFDSVFTKKVLETVLVAAFRTFINFMVPRYYIFCPSQSSKRKTTSIAPRLAIYLRVLPSYRERL